MPTITENRQQWDRYDWTRGGAEWSRPWGSVSSQWYTTVLPRISRFLPAARILEIGCGYGRWTEYLKDHCDHLTAVDLSEPCVRACRRRLASDGHVECHVTDGVSLGMIKDQTVGFAFSFDSLVHADPQVIDAYLRELNRVLSPDGVAFIHHSNVGEYQPRYSRIARHKALRRMLVGLGFMDGYLHWRDQQVSAQLVQTLASRNGLTCITQEIIHWRTRAAMIDCFSTIVRTRSMLARAPRVLKNTQFMTEVKRAHMLSQLYDMDWPAGRPPGAAGDAVAV